MNVNTDNWPKAHRLTVGDFRRVAEAGVLAPDDRVELIHGEIVDMPPIGSRHAAAVTVLAKRLTFAAGDTVDVRVQAPVTLAPDSEPQPGIALVKPRSDAYRTTHPAAQDILLLIEVGEATLRFDRERKSRLYAEHRIPEYWVVDLIGGRVFFYSDPNDGSYTQRSSTGGGTRRLESLNLEIDLSGLF